MAAFFWLRKEAIPISMSDIDIYTEEQAHSLLASMRWKSEDQQTCPHCGVQAKHYFRRTRLQWSCRD
ncbi:transposase, partial [Enterobacter roggenkampii]